jgi:hypothetical protein
MNISEILTGSITNISVEEQKDVLEQMKKTKVFELNESEKINLINFLCEKVDVELGIDYLFHVLDEEISYPIDDEKVKFLFSDDRMRKMKDLMMEKLQDEDVSDEETAETEQ